MPSLVSRITVVAVVALFAVGGAAALPPNGPSPSIVISQVYGGGGSTSAASGAVYNTDFIELFNRGATPQSVAGWSVQYASATGTGNFTATALPAVTIPAGGYLLVGEGTVAGAVGAPLPPTDASGAIAMSATAGKVALVQQATSLACNGSSTPCSAAQTALILDLVGYGNANFSETAPAPTLAASTAAVRAEHGCTDTDSNAADFTAGLPTPRNSATTAAPCGTPPPEVGPTVTSTTPANGDTGVATNANVTVVFSEAVNADVDAFSIACPSGFRSPAVSFSADKRTYTLDSAIDFAPGEACTVTVTATMIHDVDTSDPPDNLPADHVFSFTVAAPVVPIPIHDIQGAAHISPRANQNVATTGVVTAVKGNGFYIQDPAPDANPDTSEAIFVFTSVAPTVTVGNGVQVSGRVSEFRPGATGLTNTELVAPLTVTVLAPIVPLPAATVIGPGGRVPPTEVIDDDATGEIETSGVFEPATDGIDFWESLEMMRLDLGDPGRRRPDELVRRDARAGAERRGHDRAHAARRDPHHRERLQPGAGRDRRPDRPRRGHERRRPLREPGPGSARLQLRRLRARGDHAARRRPRRRHAGVDDHRGPERAVRGDVQRREPRSGRPAVEVRPARRRSSSRT